ncbi:MAG: SDR family NAD(P)-dependent oxidoreductase [Haloferacaceae archaeon]
MPETDLTIEGESAAVTAAGRGIGREIAAALVDAGVDVAVNDVDADAASEAAAGMDGPGRAVAAPGDVGDPGDAAGVVETAVEAFGGLDILVNNVGVAGPRRPCEGIEGDEFMETLRVNLGGVFNPTRAAIPHLRESDAGRVVNVSSKSAKLPRTNRTPYAASKMGIIGFTRALALELAEDGITANTVCPGTVEGDRLDRVMETRAENTGRPVAEVREGMRRGSPMNEFTRPEDVADMVLVLCSTRAERVVGQDLNVSSGRIMF